MSAGKRRSSDSVSMKYLMFHSVKSVVFTKLELTTNQKKAKLGYKIDTGSDGDSMPF